MYSSYYFNAVVQIAAAFIQSGQHNPEEIIPLSINVVNKINTSLNETTEIKKAIPFKSAYSEAATKDTTKETVSS